MSSNAAQHINFPHESGPLWARAYSYWLLNKALNMLHCRVEVQHVNKEGTYIFTSVTLYKGRSRGSSDAVRCPLMAKHQHINQVTPALKWLLDSLIVRSTENHWAAWWSMSPGLCASESQQSARVIEEDDFNVVNLFTDNAGFSLGAHNPYFGVKLVYKKTTQCSFITGTQQHQTSHRLLQQNHHVSCKLQHERLSRRPNCVVTILLVSGDHVKANVILD